MENTTDKQIFDYLLSVSNGKLTLTSDELSKVIGISAKQQSILRSNGTFPIKHTTIGRIIHYPITSIIKYLKDGANQVEEKPIQKATIRKQKTSKTVQDVSHIFMLRNFANSLNRHLEEITKTHEFVTKLLQSVELKRSLEHELCCKEATQKHLNKA